MIMETVEAAAFKSQCLKLLDEVAATRKSFVITKNGTPLVKVVPILQKTELFGALRGVLREDDIISPLENEWDSARHLK